MFVVYSDPLNLSRVMDATVDLQVTCVTGNCAHRTCGLLLLCVTIVRVNPEGKDVIRARLRVGKGQHMLLICLVMLIWPGRPHRVIWS